MTPRVNSEGERCDAENANPANRNGREDGAESRGEREQESHGEGLGK